MLTDTRKACRRRSLGSCLAALLTHNLQLGTASQPLCHTAADLQKATQEAAHDMCCLSYRQQQSKRQLTSTAILLSCTASRSSFTSRSAANTSVIEPLKRTLRTATILACCQARTCMPAQLPTQSVSLADVGELHLVPDELPKLRMEEQGRRCSSCL